MSDSQKLPQNARPFDERDLWGRDGQPGADDIRQKRFGNCYLVSAAGAVAEQSPEVIRSAIRYNAATGNFSVRLFQQGEWVDSSVTQAELRDNLARRGGSTFGARDPDAGGGLWPAVYEIGYAKARWGDWEMGRVQLGNGGSPTEALQAITGHRPLQLSAEQVEQLGIRATGEKITSALASGQRVLMATNKDPWSKWDGSLSGMVRNAVDDFMRPETDRDGVKGNHVYMVVGARYDAETGQTLIKVRNPWGHNQNSGAFTEKNAREWRPEPEIEVSLERMMRNDAKSLNRFDIGQLSEQQRGLFEGIRSQVGGRANEDAIALAAVQANREGITSGAQLRAATVTDEGKLWVAGTVPGFRTMVDTRSDLPSADESMRTLARETLADPVALQPPQPSIHRS